MILRRWQTARVTRPSGVALHLSRIGAHVSQRFAQRLRRLDLTPPQVAVLRVVGQQPGLTQQALSDRLGTAPSRVVRLVDELQERGLLERRRDPADRRQHALHVPDAAHARIEELLAEIAAHDAEVTADLTASERATLLDLLDKVGTALGAHPPGPAEGRGAVGSP